MDTKKQLCLSCGASRHIVNSKYQLCLPCNRVRLDRETVNVRKKRKVSCVKRVSKKGEVIADNLKQVYQHIDQTREQVCVGCGTTCNLSRAHIISRQKCHNLGKSELIYDERNIAYLCLSVGETKGCHSIWDDGKEEDKVHLLCYEDFQQWLSLVHQSK